MKGSPSKSILYLGYGVVTAAWLVAIAYGNATSAEFREYVPWYFVGILFICLNSIAIGIGYYCQGLSRGGRTLFRVGVVGLLLPIINGLFAFLVLGL